MMIRREQLEEFMKRNGCSLEVEKREEGDSESLYELLGYQGEKYLFGLEFSLPSSIDPISMPPLQVITEMLGSDFLDYVEELFLDHQKR